MERYVVAVALLLQLFLLGLVTAEVPSRSKVGAVVKNTKFVGELTIRSNVLLAHFRGIRYGQPPVGDKRFQKSTMYQYEESTVVAKKNGNVCPQKRDDNIKIHPFDEMEEDCLFMNIMVPLGANSITTLAVDNVADLSSKKAVYVFLHDGAFLKGSSNALDTSELSSRGDVIIVTVNYRLGILGFLTTDDDVMPANLGLWDQQLAIRWVKQNIEAFGGDSSRITVGGQYAGSVSAILQSLYEGNEDVFQNTIAQSGTPFAMTVVSEEGLSSALEVAKMAGCNLGLKKGRELSEKILECLEEISAKDLVDLKHPRRIGPVLDNEFISKETFDLCPQAIQRFKIPNSIPVSFSRKNLLIGFHSYDGWVAIQHFLSSSADGKGLMLTKDSIHTMRRLPSPEVLGFFLRPITTDPTDATTTRAIVHAIFDHYSSESKEQDDDMASPGMDAIAMMTDMYFATPAINTAHLHSLANACGRLDSSDCDMITEGKTFVYEFHATPSSNVAARTLPDMTEFTLRAWSNFIKTGNPNPNGSKEWLEYTEEARTVCDVSYDLTHDNEKHIGNGRFLNELLSTVEESVGGQLAREKREILPCPKVAGADARYRALNEPIVVFCLFVCSALCYIIKV